MIDNRKIAWFLAIAFGVAWILFLLPAVFGPPGSIGRQVATAIAWTAAMWAPGLAAIITTRFVAREDVGRLGLRRLGPRRPYLWAWLLPPALTVVAGLLTVLLGAGRFDPELTAIREVMARATGGQGVPPELVVVAQVVAALTVAPLFNALFALGEELGWRGFLLRELLPLGQGRAIALSSAVWGLWHAPAIVQGLNYPGQPLLGIPMMIVFCLLVGTIFSWLYLKTGSPWAPALGHGSLNATAGLPVLFLQNVDIVIGGTIASVIGWIPLALFVGWLFWSHRLPSPSSLTRRESFG